MFDLYGADGLINLDDHRPHITSKVICLKCHKRWISVRPIGTLLEQLECPNCGAGFAIESGEVIFPANE